MVVLHGNMLAAIQKLGAGQGQGQGGRGLGSPGVAVLGQLASLLALTHVEQQLGDYLEDGYLTGGWVTLSVNERVC